MTDIDLLRFVSAQAHVHKQVIEELTAGRKRSHWIWFVFPQLSGLGHSATAKKYAIRDMDQATRYLADTILGNRLRHNVRLMLDNKGQSALEILGEPDDIKFRSCLTLFREAAFDESDRSLFTEALEILYAGQSDALTLQLLRSE